MKIQDLAIIFVIIILPISIVLSAYTQYQIQTVNTQTLYDSKLTAATYDAIKAYQLNAKNSTTSELSNSKIRDIEASVATFRNSIMNTFRLNGYAEEELDNYIPALVYTMYDGFYIYSPYKNVNYQYQTYIDETTGEVEYALDSSGNKIPAQNNGENIYGLKPYISYSCRYIKGDIDVVITYALDNYITVQGSIGGEYVNKSGYLVDGISVDYERGKVTYNGVTIESEQLKEYLPIHIAGTNTIPEAYPYVKINGTKYYRVDFNTDIDGDDTIIYLSNGTIVEQAKLTKSPGDEGYDEYRTSDEYITYMQYSNRIDNSNLARLYYKEAKEFTEWIRSSGLESLTCDYAYDYEYDETQHEYVSTKIWENNTTPIFEFDSTINIENELSNFNQHRLAVIRHKIESNLAIAIANYNEYSQVINEFQMPELKEDEWDYVIHNISLISFLQGLPIGGKVYNGYTIVTNSESEEVVQESSIYILADDGAYHKVGDKAFESGETPGVSIVDTLYGGKASVGRLNLDFMKKIITNNNQYYPLQKYNASYNSIVMQDNVTSYEDIYEYVNNQSDDFKIAFYTALGRERMGKIYEIGKASLYGDVNCDGVVNEADVVDLLWYTLHQASYPLTEEGIANADVNLDGWIDDGDVRIILFYCENVINILPVPGSEL